MPVTRLGMWQALSQSLLHVLGRQMLPLEFLFSLVPLRPAQKGWFGPWVREKQNAHGREVDPKDLGERDGGGNAV